jgi:hypothetical protein
MLDGQELLTKGRIAAEYAVRRRTLPEHCETRGLGRLSF